MFPQSASLAARKGRADVYIHYGPTPLFPACSIPAITIVGSFRKKIAGLYERQDIFIRQRIIQHSRNPQPVVHVIGRIDAGNAVELFRLLGLDLQIHHVEQVRGAILVEDRTLHIHDEGEPFPVHGGKFRRTGNGQNVPRENPA